MSIPEPFVSVHLRDPLAEVGLVGVCACFEQGEWRCEGLAAHLMEWLPDFALSRSDVASVGAHNMVNLIRRAAKTVYASDLYKHRGEFGELLLHVVARQCFESEPAISKIYFKDSPNDTVKGFDCVHVVEGADGLELWLGEAKFYSEAGAAIRDACRSLEEHVQRDYLRTEFLCIGNKVEDSWHHAAALKRLIHSNTSLDTIFRRCRIPVLITYDSAAVNEASACDEEFRATLEAELRRHYNTFARKLGTVPVHVELILFPLKQKEALVRALHRELSKWQSL